MSQTKDWMMPTASYTVGTSVGQVEPPGDRICSQCGHRDQWLIVSPFTVTCLSCGNTKDRQ